MPPSSAQLEIKPRETASQSSRRPRQPPRGRTHSGRHPEEGEPRTSLRAAKRRDDRRVQHECGEAAAMSFCTRPLAVRPVRFEPALQWGPSAGPAPNLTARQAHGPTCLACRAAVPVALGPCRRRA